MKPLGIVIDFDGTVTERDIGDAIVKRFGLPGWDALEAKFHAGEATIRQLWIQEISRLPGDRVAEMTAFALETAKVRPGLRELLDYALEHGLPVEIASNGIEFYLNAILAANGLKDLQYVCLKADFSPEGSSQLVIPEDIVSCARNAMCKCARIWRMQRMASHVLFAGDGMSDACAGPEADILAARSSLARMAEAKGWAYIPFEDFWDVLAAVKKAV
ncbi:MAG: hypothetical protein EXR57_00485 [Dehalococcoidia bacterium]|nr:hypothetical protein [Dehalococcoidia bacterium]MSQ34281.1 hypothetical protein [Dehalococcoidia bacterium]